MQPLDRRFKLIVLLVPLLLCALSLVEVASDGAIPGAVAWAQDPPPPQSPPPSGGADVDIKVTTDDGVWYTEPVWVALGAAVVILLVALIVAGSRSGGTTVIKS